MDKLVRSEAFGARVSIPGPSAVPYRCPDNEDTLMPAAAQAKSQEAVSHHGHICIVTETYPPEINGVSLTLGHLVEGLTRIGNAVSLVRPRQRSFDTSGRHYGYKAILVRGLPLPGYKGLQFGLPAGKLLRSFWKHHRPDVVYVATEGPLGW